MTGFTNYSKWDRLEISDDEKDAHPNIDSSLMIRIKREQRARREAEETERIAALTAEGTPEALARVAKIEANRKLHVNNICRVVDEKTLLNKKPTAVAAAAEEDPDEKFARFANEYEEAIMGYAELEEFEAMEKYLLYEHAAILDENSCSVLLLKMLDMEMEGYRAEMLHVVRQYLVLRNILDLGKEARRTEEYRPFVQLFFKTVRTDATKMEALQRETQLFAQNIIKRAIDKKKEQEQEAAMQQQ